jgi:hypothetical protein
MIIKEFLTGALPKKAIKRLASFKNRHASNLGKPNLEDPTIAFRLYLAVKMNELLLKDSSSLH